MSNKKAVARFNKYMEGKLQEHRLHDRLVAISKILQKNPQDKKGIHMLEMIDKQTIEILKTGEKQCRKITSNPLPFSLPVAHWIHWKWTYQGLLKIASGTCKSIGNARRRARKEGLNTFNLTEQQCLDALRFATATYFNSKLMQMNFGKSTSVIA